MLNKLSKEAQKEAKRRGKIKEKTSIKDVLNHLKGEVEELEKAIDVKKQYPDHNSYTCKIMTDVGESIDSETYEEVFKNSIGDEIADVIITALTLSKVCEIDIDWYVKNKMKYNKERKDQ